MRNLSVLCLVTMTVSAYPQFGVHQRISPAHSYPWQVRTADLDGDGDADAIAAVAMDNRVVWFENDGSGGFGAAQEVIGGATYAKFIEPADMDGDGDIDIVSGSGTDAEFEWVENDGLGNFTTSHAIFSTTGDPWALTVVDMDGDGDFDIVTSVFGGVLHWHENSAQGIGWQTHPIGTNMGVADVAVADFHGDALPDLLLACTGTLGTVRWCANLGGGAFGAPQTITTGTSNGIEVEAVDLDNDGDADVAYSSNWNHIVGWIENTGGAFAAPTVLDGNLSLVTGLAVADADGNGWKDVVVSVKWNNSVRIFPNNAGSFGTAIMVTTDPNNPISVVLDDLDGDADLDVLHCSDGDARIAWCEQLGPGAYAEHDITRGVDYPVNILTADLDMDGDQDVITNSWTDGDVFWFPNDGSGQMGPMNRVGEGLMSSTAPSTIDLDQDGDPDLSMAYYHGTVGWYANDGNGGFGTLNIVSTNDTAIRSFATRDLNGDGLPDLITASSLNNGKLCWYPNLGGSFGAQQVVEPDIAYSGLASGDLDGDGDNDLLVAASQDRLAWYANDGSGGFGAWTLLADSVNQCYQVFIRDIDTDGDEDILTVRQPIIVFDGGVPVDTLPNVFWMANDGAGNFGPQQGIADFVSSTTAYVVDVDSDGDPDVITSNSSAEGSVICWLNDGTGEFAAAGELPTPFGSQYNLGHGDLDGDGDPDLLVSETQYDRIGWNENYFGSAYRIEGQAFLDIDGDGLFSAGDTTGAFLSVATSPVLSTAFTDTLGNYTFWLDSGAYEVSSASPGVLWQLSTGMPSYSVDLNSNTPVATGIDFGFAPSADTTIIEPSIVLGSGPCGGSAPLWINFANRGTRVEQGNVRLDLDPLIAFVTSTPPPDSIVGGSCFWGFDSLFYFGSASVQVFVQLPPFAQAGATLVNVLSVHRADGSGLVTHSFMDSSSTVLPCAYDPNDKQVEPVGYGSHGAVPIDQSRFTFTVRFQNTGTAPTYHVMVRDLLSTWLDPASVEIMAASHLVTHAGVEPDGEFVVRFDGIMLPDSSADALGSQGFVRFSAAPLLGLTSGTAIENTAAIFFDFNPPVITNTTLNTLVDCDLWTPQITWLDVDLLEATPGDAYQWFLDGAPMAGATGQDMFPPVSGSYTVEVISVHGCVATSDPYQVIFTSVIEEGTLRLVIVPNPFNSTARVIFNGPMAMDHVLDLVDVNGRVLRTIQGKGQLEITIAREGLAPGLYVLRLSGPDGHRLATRLVID